MCEMLVRVVDKINRDDPYLDAQCLKSGDVVVVVEDGWKWSPEELKNPDWRIVKLPRVSVDEGSVFLGPEFNKDPANPSKVLQRRAFKFDVGAIADPSIKVAIDDKSRLAPTITADLALPQVLALKVEKPPLTDPNVFGDPVDVGVKG